MPVYEERRLRRPAYGFSLPWSVPQIAEDAALPLGLPRNRWRYTCIDTREAAGLQLATNGDILVGRADNGKILSRPFTSHCCPHFATNGVPYQTW